MKRLDLIGPYNDYGNPELWDKKSNIKCYADSGIYQVNEYKINQVALLIEPRPIQPNVYKKIEENYKLFSYVFTHDSKLLKEIPNAYPIIWGGCWCREYNDTIKDKYIGILTSHKYLTELHKVRYDVAMKYKDKDNIDIYGPYNDTHRIDPIIAHERYKYVVIVENYIDDIWFTEKLIDAFSTKCIPIYLGARNIGEYFNTKSMLIVKDRQELEDTIDELLDDIDYWTKFYYREDIQKAIEDNYNRSKKYWNFEKAFLDEYQYLFELMN